MIQLLKEVGIDACDSYKRTALVWASFYNNTNLLNWLIDNGANLNHQDKTGFSALHSAAQEKNFEATEILIKKGANLELKDSWGNTPLMRAINSTTNYKFIELLIQSGANLDNVNNYGMTPRLVAESMAGFDVEVLKAKI